MWAAVALLVVGGPESAFAEAQQCNKKQSGTSLGGPRAGAKHIETSGRGLAGRGHNRGRLQALQTALAQLDLNETQKGQVASLLSERQAAGKKAREKMKPRMQSLGQQLRAAKESGDTEKIRKLRSERRNLVKQNRPAGGSIREGLARILTPEQLRQLRQKMRALRGNQGKKSARRKEGQRGNGASRRRGTEARENPNAPVNGAGGRKLDL